MKLGSPSYTKGGSGFAFACSSFSLSIFCFQDLFFACFRRCVHEDKSLPGSLGSGLRELQSSSEASSGEDDDDDDFIELPELGSEGVPFHFRESQAFSSVSTRCN